MSVGGMSEHSLTGPRRKRAKTISKRPSCNAYAPVTESQSHAGADGARVIFQIEFKRHVDQRDQHRLRPGDLVCRLARLCALGMRLGYDDYATAWQCVTVTPSAVTIRRSRRPVAPGGPCGRAAQAKRHDQLKCRSRGPILSSPSAELFDHVHSSLINLAQHSTWGEAGHPGVE